MKRSNLQMGDLPPELRRRLTADVEARRDDAPSRDEAHLVHWYDEVLRLIADDWCPITELVCGLLPSGEEFISLDLVDELIDYASLETRPEWDRRQVQGILAKIGRANIFDNRRINALTVCRRYSDPRTRYARRQTHMVFVGGYTVYLEVTEMAEGKWTYAPRADRLAAGHGLRRATSIEPWHEAPGDIRTAPDEPYYDRRAKRLLIQSGHAEYADLDLRHRLVSVDVAEHPNVQAMRGVELIWV